MKLVKRNIEMKGNKLKKKKENHTFDCEAKKA